jgi:tetratricopeptide (TPR) repeat protein
MRYLLPILVSLFFLAGCNDGKQPDSLLQQPPFASLTDSITQAPANAALYYKRGVLLYQNNHKGLAEADIRKAWSLQPTEEYGLSLTTILKEKGADSAVLFLEDAVRRLPESIALHVGLARGYQAKGDKEKALAITSAILQQYPGQLDALTLQAELLKDEKPAASLAQLEKAYSLIPSDPALAYDLAYAYAENKNAKVLALTDSLIGAKAPEMEKAFYTKAFYYANVGRGAEALANFDKAIQANYNFLDAYLDKGKLLYEQKKYSLALETFQRGLRVRSTEAQFYFWIAKTQLAMGNRAEAKVNFERAYGLDKELTEAKSAAESL